VQKDLTLVIFNIELWNVLIFLSPFIPPFWFTFLRGKVFTNFDLVTSSLGGIGFLGVALVNALLAQGLLIFTLLLISLIV